MGLDKSERWRVETRQAFKCHKILSMMRRTAHQKRRNLTTLIYFGHGGHCIMLCTVIGILLIEVLSSSYYASHLILGSILQLLQIYWQVFVICYTCQISICYCNFLYLLVLSTNIIVEISYYKRKAQYIEIHLGWKDV